MGSHYFRLVYEEDDPYQPPILPQGVSSIDNSTSLSKNEFRFSGTLQLYLHPVS